MHFHLLKIRIYWSVRKAISFGNSCAFQTLKFPFDKYLTDFFFFLLIFLALVMSSKIWLMRLRFLSFPQRAVLYYVMTLSTNLSTICCFNSSKNALSKWSYIELLTQMLVSTAFLFCVFNSRLPVFFSDQVYQSVILSVCFKRSCLSTKQDITADIPPCDPLKPSRRNPTPYLISKAPFVIDGVFDSREITHVKMYLNNIYNLLYPASTCVPFSGGFFQADKLTYDYVFVLDKWHDPWQRECRPFNITSPVTCTCCSLLTLKCTPQNPDAGK